MLDDSVLNVTMDFQAIKSFVRFKKNEGMRNEIHRRSVLVRARVSTILFFFYGIPLSSFGRETEIRRTPREESDRTERTKT